MTEPDERGDPSPRRAWPPSRDALLDTSRCPSCFTPIAGPSCDACGLDLAHPRTFAVLDLSQRVADLWGTREQTLAEIHADGDRAAAATRAAAEARAAVIAPDAELLAPSPGPGGFAPPTPPAPAPVAVTPSAPAATPPGMALQPPSDEVSADGVPSASVPDDAAVAPAAPGTGDRPPGAPRTLPIGPAKPRRSSVQVFLLSVGVVLLAVAAAFFLTVAWVSGGLILRSIIVALVTAGVIVTASLLRRRGLTATAEGIALLGIALVALDVWAVRANDFAGMSAIAARPYWGAAALVAGAGFVVWARVSRLRSPFSGGVAALCVGPPLLAGGFFGAGSAASWYSAGLAILVIALAAPLVPRLARSDVGTPAIEVAAVRGSAGVGVLVALAAALLFEPQSTWAPVLAVLPVAALVVGHAISAARLGPVWLPSLAAPLAVLVFGAGVAATTVRLADVTFSVTVPLLLLAVVALGLDVVTGRARLGVARTALRAATVTAAVAAGIAALFPLAVAVGTLAVPARGIGRGFGRSAFEADWMDATATGAVIVLVAVVVLAIIVWRLAGLWAQRHGVALWSALAGALLVGPQLRVVVAVVLWYLALAVVAVVLLRRRRGDTAMCVALGAIALPLGWGLSFSSPLAWTLATLTVAGVLWAVAPLRPYTRVPAIVVLVLFLSGSAFLTPTVIGIAFRAEAPLPDNSTAAALAAAVCVALALLPLRGRVALDSRQRESGAFTGLVVVMAAGLWSFSLIARIPEYLTWMLFTGVVATVSTALLVAAPAFRTWRVVRPFAAVLLPLLLAATTVVAARFFDPTPLAVGVVLAAVAVAVAALALWRLRDEAMIRALVDAGTAVVVVSAAVAVAPGDRLWIPLVFAAVTVLLWAVDTDGLFVSRGPRRNLIWLAVAVATGALWVRLLGDDVTTVEAFTLPVAAALLAIAVAEERARRRVEGRSEASPAVIAFGGAVLALAPTALAGPDDLIRGTVAGAASVVLLVTGAWVRPPRTPAVLPLALAAAGGIGLLLVLAGRLVHVVERGTAGGALVDLAVVVTAVAFGTAAIGLARAAVTWAVPSARALLVGAVVVAALGETVLVVTDAGPLARALLAVVLLGAVGVLAFRLPHRLTGAVPGSVALAAAGVLAAAALGAGVRPIEWMTVPLAVILVISALPLRDGAIRPPEVARFSLGLAVGLLPSAVLSSDGLVRATVVLTVGAALVFGLPWFGAGRVRPFVLPGIGFATAALVVVGGLRLADDLFRPSFDAWMLAVTVPLWASAVILRRRPIPTATWMPDATILVASGFAALATGAHLFLTGQSTLRTAVTLVVLLAIGGLWRSASGIVFWGQFTLAALVGAVAFVSGTAESLEVVTAPLAAALVVQGTRALQARPEARSWPTLGPGLVLLLVPSLLFDFASDNALWRVIALGVAAVVVLLVGARLRLQAPVLLGGVTLLIHAVAQLWPWIAAIYESAAGLWWLWLGIAGVLLIVVAATYERRIRELRAVALAIRALR